MTKYNWKQPGGDVWLVESDIEKGTITVKSKNTGETVLRRSDLTENTINVIEENFFSVVADEIIEHTGAHSDMMYR